MLGVRRLERLIRTADRSRQALLHCAWIFLLVTWCIGWPVVRWMSARHEAVTRIQPPVVSLQDLSAEASLPDFLQLDATPRLRHGIEVIQPDGTHQFFVPLTATLRDSEEVRFVALGLPRYLLDPKSPLSIKPPFALQLEPSGLPASIRREMSRRGLKFAETVYFAKSIELANGRVQNRHAATDRLIETVLTVVGTSVGVACLLGWVLCALRLRRLRALSPAAVLP